MRTVMGKEYHPGLLGFDSFEVKLGDQLRGERASKGKSLLDVQRELRLLILSHDVVLLNYFLTSGRF